MNRKLLISTLFLLVVLFTPPHIWAFTERVEYLQELKTYLKHPVDVEVAPSGDIYILDSRTCEIIVFRPSGEFKFLCGSKGSKPGQLRNPRSLAVTPSGQIVVADTGNQRIQVFDQDGQFQFDFGNAGTGRGEFHSPTAVAVDATGYLYVLDAGNRRVQSFSPKGIHIGILPLPYSPNDLAVDGFTNIYVLCTKTGKIFQYSSQGKLTKEFTCTFGRKNYLRYASAIDVDSRGDVYFSEIAENSVKKIEWPDKLILAFGSEGNDRGQFRIPLGLSVSTDDRLCVADSRNRRVEIFNITGNPKEPLPIKPPLIPLVEFDTSISSNPSIIDLTANPSIGLLALSDIEGTIDQYGPTFNHFKNAHSKEQKLRRPKALSFDDQGAIYVADTKRNRVRVLNEDGSLNFKFGKKGSKTGFFSQPQGIVVNAKKNVYVADTLNSRIQIFNDTGIFLNAFGMAPSTEPNAVVENRFEPKSLAMDSQGRIYAVDFRNNRVLIFDEIGNPLDRFGSKGSNFDQFDRPVDIAIDENDFRYVADQGNHRIQVFGPDGKFITAFGSHGKGPSYFPKLSGVAAYDGKIYVSNHGLEMIKVFSFNSSSLALKTSGKDSDKTFSAVAGNPSLTSPAQDLAAQETKPQETTTSQEPTPNNALAPLPQDNVTPDASQQDPQKTEDSEKTKPEADTSQAQDRITVTKTFYLPPNFDRNNKDHVIQVQALTKNEAIKDLVSQLGVDEQEIIPYIRIEKEEYVNNDQFKMTVSAPKTY